MYIKGIKVKNIDWCIKEEDIRDEHEWAPMTDEEIQSEIKNLKSTLPAEEYIPVESDKLSVIGEKIDDIADWLSDCYGWLVDSYNYCLVDEEGKECKIRIARIAQ